MCVDDSMVGVTVVIGEWMAHGIGCMAEHTIGEAIHEHHLCGVDVNGKHNE